jgi:hypothetical protein
MPCDPPDPKLRETVLSALRASGFPIERSADRVHAEQARLRALGIIDDQGNPLRPLPSSRGGQGDPGEW